METAVQTKSAYLSHDEYPVALEQAVRDIRARVYAEGDQPGATVAQQLRVVDDLLQFGLGRYLLVHQGYNGYWTRYVAGLQPGCGLDAGVNDEGKPFSDLEQWILRHSPAACIVRERMRMAQAILQPLLRDGVAFASLPCGAMDDLLSLRDFAPKDSGGKETFREDVYPNVRLVGIDKVGGILITCFTPPSPAESPNSPWNLARIGQENLQRYDLVYRHVLRPKWSGNRRTEQQVTGALRSAGFAKVELRPDSWGLCITAVATK